MEKKKRTNVNTLGEFGLIDHLTNTFETVRPETVMGVGDDAAVIQMGKQLALVTTDMLVEGIHFDYIYTPMKHLGYKAVISNLSDIYAMNGVPMHVTVSIAISNKYSVEDLEELYDGIRTACRNYQVDLIGGDTTSSTKGMIVSVTAIGKVAPQNVVYRSGANEGDVLCVSGDLGAAFLGLQLLEREKQIFMEQPDVKIDLEDQSYLVGRHLKPEARQDVVVALGKMAVKPSAMIDISDGLSSDVFHICERSGVGVKIEEAKVPINHDAEMQAINFNLDPITCALNGGEDYELLFTVSPADYEKLKGLPEIYVIGEIMPVSYGRKLLSSGGKEHDLLAQGWVHMKE